MAWHREHAKRQPPAVKLLPISKLWPHRARTFCRTLAKKEAAMTDWFARPVLTLKTSRRRFCFT